MKMYKCAAKSLSLEPSNPTSNFTPSHEKTKLPYDCLRSEIVLLPPEFYLLPPWPALPLVAPILFLPD